jgi:DNA-binding transcriptional ArsR family regulator
MLDVEVIECAAAATVALQPARSRLLAELAEPASASTLAARLGIPRQKVNYHLRALESHGLVHAVDSRKWAGSPSGGSSPARARTSSRPPRWVAAASNPARALDRLSASYLITLAARAVREVGGLVRRALAADKRLATLSIDTEIHFRSPEDRAAFSQELAASVAALAARYHDAAAPGARRIGSSSSRTLSHTSPSQPPTPNLPRTPWKRPHEHSEGSVGTP